MASQENNAQQSWASASCPLHLCNALREQVNTARCGVPSFAVKGLGKVYRNEEGYTSRWA